MGVDKARVPFPERRPMALFVADRLRPLCSRVRLVRRGQPDGLPWPGVAVVRDAAPEGDAHPLWGVAAALQAAASDHVLLLSCDRPWIQTHGLRRLCRPGGAVAVDASGEVQPLVACLPTSLAAAAVEAAAEGRSARSFVAELPRVTLPDAQLRDLDRWEDGGRRTPLEELRARLPPVSEEAWHTIARAECARLAARGVLHPLQSQPTAEDCP